MRPRFHAAMVRRTTIVFRARDAGFELAIADHCYVYHAKSKSFGRDARDALARDGDRSLKGKYGTSRIESSTGALRNSPVLSQMRAAFEGAPYRSPNGSPPYFDRGSRMADSLRIARQGGQRRHQLRRSRSSRHVYARRLCTGSGPCQVQTQFRVVLQRFSCSWDDTVFRIRRRPLLDSCQFSCNSCYAVVYASTNCPNTIALARKALCLLRPRLRALVLPGRSRE